MGSWHNRVVELQEHGTRCRETRAGSTGLRMGREGRPSHAQGRKVPESGWGRCTSLLCYPTPCDLTAPAAFPAITQALTP